MTEYLPFFMFVFACAALMAGYPVAFTLSGVALAFAYIGWSLGVFDPIFLSVLPDRIFGVMQNETLMAVPLFVLMGMILEKTDLAKDLLNTLGQLWSRLPGGLGVSVVAVGTLLAASTGIVGATVVTLGLISLPTLLRHGYQPSLATGLICATGTLGQIIPPSIVLVLLGDVLSNAYQDALRSSGDISGATVSVGDLFFGSLIPGLLLVFFYSLYVVFASKRSGAVSTHSVDATPSQAQAASPMLSIVAALFPPLLLISLVLGSIMLGVCTPTEAASLGACGAMLLAIIKRKLPFKTFKDSLIQTVHINAMVFMILIGASVFSVVFRGLEGDELVQSFFMNLPGGVFMAVFLVMAIIFLLGFVLDFIEITFVVVPMLGPALLSMGVDPVWLGVMIALNLQTSFLTPPFGFSLFYLRGVAPAHIKTQTIYRGVIPFIIIQLAVLVIVAAIPSLATWLPSMLF